MSSSSPRELPRGASAAGLAESIPAIDRSEGAGSDATADVSPQRAGSRQAERRERRARKPVAPF